MSNNPTSILASFATMKSLVDAQQYQSPYQILAEFIQYTVQFAEGLCALQSLKCG